MKEVTSAASARAARTRREGKGRGRGKAAILPVRTRPGKGAGQGDGTWYDAREMATDPLIDEELAAFLQSGVSVHAASRDAQNVPDMVRGLACRLSADRRRVTVFLLASQCGEMLRDFAANGAIAFVASLPSTHRTVQLKGTDAVAGPPQPGDKELVARQRAAFEFDLVTLGYAKTLPSTLVAGEWPDVVAVTFTPNAAFVQTPGPGAGAPLAAKR
jgi:hypothetical protein